MEKDYTGTIQHAIAIAVKAHKGQVDKGGKPYIEHPLRIMWQMDTNQERIVAVLHDVIEDTDLTLYDLVDFDMEIQDAISLLTKKHGEPYDEYIRRVSKNRLARKVKMADLRDNMDLKRLPEVKAEDLERRSKYNQALCTLEHLQS